MHQSSNRPGTHRRDFLTRVTEDLTHLAVVVDRCLEEVVDVENGRADVGDVRNKIHVLLQGRFRSLPFVMLRNAAT